MKIRARIASLGLIASLAGTGPLRSAAAAERIDTQEILRGFAAIEAWQIDEARAIAENGYGKDPQHPLVLALVAALKFYMSDYAGAVAFFERARAAGAPAAVLQDAGLAEAARVATEGYAEEVSEHFIVRYAPGKDAILVPYAVETLERARKRLEELLGWAPRSRIVVEFYPSAATLATVSPLKRSEIETSGTIALCKWNRLMVTSPRAIVFGYAWRDTLAHELTHLVIGGASHNTVPIWLHEGIAKFAETAWRDKPGLGLSPDQQMSLLNAAKKGTLIPFEKMHPSMAKLASQDETALAFAEVFTFIEYLVGQKGWAGIRAAIEKMAEGATDVEAIDHVFGSPLSTLSGRWMAGLKNRKIQREGTLAGPREVVVKDRPDAPDDSLHGLDKKGRRYARAADLLYARGRLKAAAQELEKAYRESQSPPISARLALVALAAGDLARAESAARQSIEASPDMPGPNVTLAEVLVRRGKAAEATVPLDRAIAINPFDPRIHLLRLAVLGPDGDPAARAQAERAHALLIGTAGIRPPLLGTGGTLAIEAVPFSRVFVEIGENEVGMIPTGMVTPTAPLDLRPGAVRIRLVPPEGPAVIRPVMVEKLGHGEKPQRIAPDMRGS